MLSLTKTVPKFKSIQEEAEFWDTHSTEDFPDYWKDAPDVKFAKNLKSIYIGNVFAVKLDSKTKKKLAKIAKKKGVGTSTAAEILLKEHLSEINVV